MTGIPESGCQAAVFKRRGRAWIGESLSRLQTATSDLHVASLIFWRMPGKALKNRLYSGRSD
jgi:hypothetical protein